MFEWIPVSDLRPYPGNSKRHPKEQIDRLAKGIQYYGWRHPILISKQSGFIVVGHARLEAAKKLGLKEVPVHFQDFDSIDQENGFRIADNAYSELGELDFSAINAELENLGPDFDLDLLGLGEDFELEPADKYGDADAVPEIRKTTIQRGDLFLLGSHRLLCGDATCKEDVERLMNGEKADLFLSDPPYGVSYTDKNEYLNRLGKAMACPKAIENDHQTPEEMKIFWDSSFLNACESLSDKASYYIFAPQGGDLLLLLLQAVREAGFQLKHILVWAKNNHVLGRCDYHYKHEPIVYGWKQKGTHEFYGRGQKNTSVWDFNKPLKNDLHPTMKPAEVLEEALLNSTKKEDLVLDLFLGSGSTLIACEKTSRKCFGMEIDPEYCQVILDRFEKFSGQRAEKG